MTLLAACLTTVGLGRPTLAADVGSTEGTSAIEAHGFVSQGFIKSFRNNFLAESKSGSFEFSEVGLNFTSQLTDRLRVGLQLFAHDLGPIGNYDARADWYYLDYRIADWIGFRAGRLKIPFGLYNDIQDVDAARVPVLLPTSIYSPTSRDFLLAQTGVELYGYVGLARAGALEYRLYGGTIFLDIPVATASSIPRLNIPYVAGGRLMWETPVDGLRVGLSGQALRLDFALIAPPGPMMMPVLVDASIIGQLGIASIEYSAHDLQVAAEYSRWRLHIDSSNFMVYPGPAFGPTSVSERAYLLLAYRVRSWLQPGAYYSLYFPHTSLRSGRENMMHDVALTLRFDVNNFWLIKVEAHGVNGTADLSPALNGGIKAENLANLWGVFLVKTTAYF